MSVYIQTVYVILRKSKDPLVKNVIINLFVPKLSRLKYYKVISEVERQNFLVCSSRT